MTESSATPKKYRLLVRAEMHGAIREPGYIFTLAEGEVGPHRTAVASNHGAQITDHMNTAEQLVDLPLYEEVVVDAAPSTAGSPDQSGPSVEEQLAAKDVRIAELEALLRDAHAKLSAGRQEIELSGAGINPAEDQTSPVAPVLPATFQVGLDK